PEEIRSVLRRCPETRKVSNRTCSKSLKGYIVTSLRRRGICSHEFRMASYPCNSVSVFNHLTVRESHSQCFHPPFTGSDTHRFFHLRNKDLAIADFSGLGLFQNCFNCALCTIVGDHDLELYFWKEIHGVLGASINFAVPFLSAKSFYLAQSHSLDACCH